MNEEKEKRMEERGRRVKKVGEEGRSKKDRV
jgi:hypothetical protein